MNRARQAEADDLDQKIIFTFSGPVEIPGKVLLAGTYVFKLADTLGDREVVQVFRLIFPSSGDCQARFIGTTR
ncbi:MAG: hypothetical protein JWN92_69 [Candidatus Acidoferrum typicum]|jgi:hypothetical protein|nr:hypothetical protein [Candidatus Acidoferrum typicum]